MDQTEPRHRVGGRRPTPSTKKAPAGKRVKPRRLVVILNGEFVGNKPGR
jgi:hypothetical protein